MSSLAQRLLDRVRRPLDERFDLTNHLAVSLTGKAVPDHARRYYYCFGGITFFLLLVEAVTGMMLTMYYVPSSQQAYASVYYISHYVRYGWLVRSIHSWAAQLIMIFVLLHMIRVFVTGSYKDPRQLNWVAGVVLLLLVFGFSLTGILLPWDQNAYWRSTVTVNLVREAPLVGGALSRILMGGDNVGGSTLTRFFSAHIMLLPAVAAAFLVAHFWMVRRQGISGPM